MCLLGALCCLCGVVFQSYWQYGVLNVRLSNSSILGAHSRVGLLTVFWHGKTEPPQETLIRGGWGAPLERRTESKGRAFEFKLEYWTNWWSVSVPHWFLALLTGGLAILIKPKSRFRFTLREFLMAMTIATIIYGSLVAMTNLKIQDSKTSLRVMRSMIRTFSLIIGLIVVLPIARAQEREVQAVNGNMPSSLQSLRNAGAKIELTDDGIIKSVTFSGDDVEPTSLRPLKDLPSLDALVLSEVNKPEPLLVELADLPQPRQLSLLFTPVRDSHIETLKQFKSVKVIHLYGTLITPDGLSQLKRALPNTLVDFRSGAFLGIRGKDHPQGAEIIDVVGAARASGLQRGDVITHWNDKPVADFPALVAIVSGSHVGKKVVLTVLREGTQISKEVMLGRFQMPRL